jgi:hypothetical protein
MFPLGQFVFFWGLSSLFAKSLVAADVRPSGGVPQKRTLSRLYVVYNCFINFNRPKWNALIEAQIKDMVHSNLIRRATGVHIAISGDYTEPTNETVASALESTVSMMKKNIPNVVVDVTMENRFEYPGIRAVWDIAHEKHLSESNANSTYILYFHTKGMFNHNPKTLINGVRTPFEKHLFETVVEKWAKAAEILDEKPHINKVGYAVAPNGFMWFNFWWARASYIRRLTQPVINMKNRFYYEGWLCMLEKDKKMWPQDIRVEIVSHDENLSYGQPSGPADCAALCLPEKITYGIVHPQPEIDTMCKFSQHPDQRRVLRTIPDELYLNIGAVGSSQMS